jgi:hypothetical protein
MSAQQTLERHKAKPLPRIESGIGQKRDKETTPGGTNESEAAKNLRNWICADPKSSV